MTLKQCLSFILCGIYQQRHFTVGAQGDLSIMNMILTNGHLDHGDEGYISNTYGKVRLYMMNLKLLFAFVSDIMCCGSCMKYE